MGSKSRNLRDIADEVVSRLDSSDGGGHDVSNEPRVAKGNGKQSGEWTTGGGPPNKAKASAHGRTVTIQHADGTTEIRSGGTPAWRNNNPGNIVSAGGWANRHGAIGSDGVFAIFPDEATGESALEAALNGPGYSSLTIDKAVAARTPKDDPRNDTERTKALVRQFSGLPGDAVIGQLSPAEKQRLYGAIRRSEGWGSGSITYGTP